MADNKFQVIHDDNYYVNSRLPTDVVPNHYKIRLTPDLKKFTFSGIVELDFLEPNKEVSEIILNAADLDIKSGFLIESDGSKTILKKIIYNDALETIALNFEKSAVKPKTLTLNFNGILNDRLKGFYRSKFSLHGQEIYAATTQFEAPDARRAFPCFDEPGFKASFDITLVYDATPLTIGDKTYKVIALSNGELISETRSDDGLTIAEFQTTPKMSTYLVAFVIGPFEYIEDQRSNEKGCRIRVYATPDKTKLGEFALDVAHKSLSFFENLFNIKYPLNKLDLIAIPDFALGAMENWGLITYRETALLYDPEKSGAVRKQRVATVVAHEIAHQWFGNLVTMAWWQDLWLNEGFATFMEHLCPDSIFPEWDLWAHYVSSDLYGAMQLDSLHSSHPIEVVVNSASEVDEIFDMISYEKGCSIIRMLYHYIGEQNFRQGISNYLKKYAYKNAITDDLWNSLEEASQKPVTKIMPSWTRQTGYPWLNVKLVDIDKSTGDMTLTLEQQKFTSNGELSSGDENVKWMIPLSMISGSPDVKLLVEVMEGKMKNIVIPKQGDNWLKINNNTIGFYRVAYPSVILEKLTKLLVDDFSKRESNPNHKFSLSSIDRLSLQNDYFALCQAGRIQPSEMIKLLACYQSEVDYTIWDSIDTCMFWLSILYRNTDYLDPFRNFGRKLFSKIFSKLTWATKPDDSHTDAMLRATVINRLISLGDEAVIDQAKRLFQEQVNDKVTIIADLKSAVYRAIATYGDDNDFNKLFDIYNTETSHEEKDRVGAALGCTKNPERLKRVVDLLLSDKVRTQNLVQYITPIGQTSPHVAWNLLVNNKKFFLDKCGSGWMNSRLVHATTGYFCEASIVPEIIKFFEENKFPSAERTIQQSVETIKLNVKWLERHSLDDQFKQSLSALG